MDLVKFANRNQNIKCNWENKRKYSKNFTSWKIKQFSLKKGFAEGTVLNIEPWSWPSTKYRYKWGTFSESSGCNLILFTIFTKRLNFNPMKFKIVLLSIIFYELVSIPKPGPICRSSNRYILCICLWCTSFSDPLEPLIHCSCI